MANSHEKTADKAKKRRRRIRQIRGMLFTLFAVIGIVTVVTGGVRILREEDRADEAAGLFREQI